MHFKINKGLNIPIAGAPEQKIEAGPGISKVALLGQDYHGLKPKLLVSEGEPVKLGQALFVDLRQADILYTSPASGYVLSIARGPRRVLQAVIIKVEGSDELIFASWPTEQLTQLKREQIISNVANSGLWTAFRTRPYSKIPPLDATPDAIFVTAMDSNPLAASADNIISLYEKDFMLGLELLSKLTENAVHVCHGPELNPRKTANSQIHFHDFTGLHPAGLVGTHMHMINPVINRTVWHIGYQDVIAIGKLFTTGRLWVERIISLAGPMALRPRLITTRLGASTEDIVRDNIEDAPCRVISGPILSGHRAVRWASFLGRYHTQLCAVPEGGARELLGWIKPNGEKHSALNVLWNSIIGKRNLRLTTLQNGSSRAIVPIGNYEDVMPLDLLATPLLKALIVGDTDMAQKLGCLELDEEDLALCSYVCSGKTDFGRALRECLNEIERNG